MTSLPTDATFKPKGRCTPLHARKAPGRGVSRLRRVISRDVLFGFALFGNALLAFEASAKTASELPQIPHEFYTLDNGLEVILHEDHSTPIVGVNVWYHVGSKNERIGRSGFAHLFEHMMFQGSEHQDAEYFGPLESVGGSANGSTNEDRTNYWEVVPANYLERALLLEADRMGWLLPAMTEEKFKNQQEVVRNERRQGEGQPYSSFWLNFNENFYPKGHPYDHSVIGIHEDLENATLDDVKDFFRTYYTPNNATLCLAGDFDPESAKTWIKKYFGEIPPGPPVEETAIWIPELKGEKRITSQGRVQLTRIHFAYHSAPYYHEGDADLDLAAKILGLGRTSRLYKRLVHKEKLAQDVAVFQASQQIGSAFIAMITLRPDVDAGKVERIFDEEVARLAKSGPTREELERAKNVFEAEFIKGVQQIGSFSGKNDRLNRYNHYLGTPDYFQKDYERYTSRTAETVRTQFAKWIGPGNGRMVYNIVPFGELEAIEAASVDRTKLPAGGELSAMPTPSVERRRLANGLELAVMKHPELPLLQMHLVFASGSAADPIELSGLAEVSAEMMLEGTKRRDKFAFESELERFGTDLEAFTADNYTVYEMTALTKHIDPSLDLLAEAILTPSFPEAELVDQKDRRLVDVRREKDNPVLTATKITRRVVYGDGHPYSQIGTGTETSIEAIGLEHVREFAQRHYTPGNATIVAVGDIDADDLAARISRAFDAWTGEAPASAKIPAVESASGRTVYLFDKPGDSQSTISVAHAGIPRNHPDWEKLFVANQVLGGMFSSRLNLNLREDKGYSYGVYCDTPPKVGVSSFSMEGRVQTEVTAAALVEFLKEFEGITKKKPITEEELSFAKDNILMSYSQGFETISQLADALTEQVAYGLPDDNFARHPEKIASVDLTTANKAAAEHLHAGGVAIVVVGDRSKIEDSIQKLKLGPIRYVDENGQILPEAELSSNR